MKRLIAALSLGCLAAVAVAAPDREDIEITFDRNKGKIYALYARELKNQPGLQGRVDLALDIATDGRVADCRVVSSTIPSPKLIAEFCPLIRQFQFAPRPARATFTKRIDFAAG